MTRRLASASSATGVVLMYHEVLPEASVPAWTVVKAGDFQEQMALLARHFDVVTLDEALGRIAGSVRGLRPFAVVTLDDGYAGNYSTVLPLMRKMGLPFTVYVATEAVEQRTLHWYDKLISLLVVRGDLDLDIELPSRVIRMRIPASAPDEKRWTLMQSLLTEFKREPAQAREEFAAQLADGYDLSAANLAMLSSRELEEMARQDVVTIGCHTHAHELLDQIGQDRRTATISRSQALIEEWTGKRPSHFAYPNGNYNEEVVETVRGYGFTTAVTTRSGWWRNLQETHTVPRYGVGRFDTLNQFKARLSGFL